MVQIDKDIFIPQIDKERVLKNISKYCSKCYKEFDSSEDIYFDTTTYEYICSRCASNLSEELESYKECVESYENEASLF